MIRNLSRTQQRVILVLGILVLLNIAAIVLLYSPVVKSGRHARQELASLRTELKAKRLQVVPALDMDKKLADARSQVSDFYGQNFPKRYSEISQTLAKAANESGVQLLGVRYSSKGAPAGLSEVDLELDVSGDYEAEIRFINALERSKMFLVIENVNLTAGQTGALRLAVGVQTFLRTAES